MEPPSSITSQKSISTSPLEDPLPKSYNKANKTTLSVYIDGAVFLV